MKESYFDAVVMIERLHRLFLEVIKVELDHLAIMDINNVQALILYNIGKNQLTVGELTHRGYYLGSNVSYNLRKMVQYRYVEQVPSPHDRRSSHVKLAPKGLDLYEKFDSILGKQTHLFEKSLEGVLDLSHFGDTLKKLEVFWMSLLNR
jgi:DNA-binding MarR family transcriptional regulator